jgi:hypothetical protein
MDPRERKWIDDGMEAVFGPWTPPSLRDETEDRAARLSSPLGRRPATDYGWGEDDPHREERPARSPMEPSEVDQLLRSLVATMEHQRSIHEDLRELNRQQLVINADIKDTLAGISVTLACVDTLLARLIPHQSPPRGSGVQAGGG